MINKNKLYYNPTIRLYISRTLMRRSLASNGFTSNIHLSLKPFAERITFRDLNSIFTIYY